MLSVLPYRQEPPQRPGQPPRTGVLLCNLGTPDAPTASAVRRYLREFLGDPRVVEIPRLAWLPLLYGVILPLRGRQSAAKYASIWSAEGSPLRVHTARQATLLEQRLLAQGHDVRVRFAMRYGNPSIAAELDALRSEGVDRVLVLPAYPQYSGTTTASVFDAIAQWGLRARVLPEFRFVQRFHDDPGYIAALAAGIEAHWEAHGRPDHLVMSFHGIPQRTVALRDPYERECRRTAELLAQRLGLPSSAWTMSFQSRFGRAKWLQPYTQATVEDLARKGVARVDVACPGFTSDCLETLEEIGMEVREAFLAAGGREFHAIACLNAAEPFIDALALLVERHTAGWPTREEEYAAEVELSGSA